MLSAWSCGFRWASSAPVSGLAHRRHSSCGCQGSSSRPAALAAAPSGCRLAVLFLYNHARAVVIRCQPVVIQGGYTESGPGLCPGGGAGTCSSSASWRDCRQSQHGHPRSCGQLRIEIGHRSTPSWSHSTSSSSVLRSSSPHVTASRSAASSWPALTSASMADAQTASSAVRIRVTAIIGPGDVVLAVRVEGDRPGGPVHAARAVRVRDPGGAVPQRGVNALVGLYPGDAVRDAEEPQVVSGPDILAAGPPDRHQPSHGVKTLRLTVPPGASLPSASYRPPSGCRSRFECPSPVIRPGTWSPAARPQA